MIICFKYVKSCEITFTLPSFNDEWTFPGRTALCHGRDGVRVVIVVDLLELFPDCDVSDTMDLGRHILQRVVTHLPPAEACHVIEKAKVAVYELATFGFEDAFPLLLRGLKLRRRSWDPCAAIFMYGGSTLNGRRVLPYLLLANPDWYTHCSLGNEDLFAQDWEIYE